MDVVAPARLSGAFWATDSHASSPRRGRRWTPLGQTPFARAIRSRSTGGDGSSPDAPICTTTQELCGGQRVERDDPKYDCGWSSCWPCDVPNAETKCASGNCAIKQCLPGYYDCDPTMAPGCESRLDGKPDPKASNVFCGDCWKGCLDGGTCAQSDASYSGYSCP